uniref:Cytochrome c oxidase subunit 2 n=1 Tax=Steganacarus magnus TaxID=52000 RepID=B6Z5U5_9ACAR|nr:cytochrome c oxidase subunit II [Steganacarus magnus]ACH41146.1 cytochrome c oxidase subunit II [Steganacarus magnus]
MPIWMSLSFQNSFSPEMESINFFHDFSMTMIIFIFLLSSYFIFSSLMGEFFDNFSIESHELELFWTFTPTLFLMFLAIPSMKVLYMTEDSQKPCFTFKITGHQWYWSYDFMNCLEEVDSFYDSSLMSRLLKVSNVVNLPSFSNIRGLVTSSDVIHSWSIPSMGVKSDCSPGRLNQVFLMSKLNMLTVGQCSEICGANHSFMPIVLIFSIVLTIFSFVNTSMS